MKIKKHSDYEEMAAAFQCFQIQTLYETLKENGVHEAKIRKICEDFTFSFGVGIDQKWIDTEVGKVFPLVGFTTKQLLYDPDTLHLNPGTFLFCEYAFGDISWFFEDQIPDQEPQKYGLADENGEPT